MREIVIGLFSLVIAATFLFDVTGVVHGQAQTSGLSIEPAIIDAGATPGSSIERTLNVINTSDAMLPIRLSTQPMRANDADGIPVEVTNAQDWIAFDEADFILEPNENRVINVSIDIPDEASPGGHYADIVLRALVLERAGQSVVTMPELTASVFVSVAGDITEQHDTVLNGRLFRLRPSAQPGELSYVVTNSGNIHSLFIPALRLEHPGSGEITSIQLEPTLLLPSESRELTFTLPDDISLGLNKALLDYRYGTEQQTVDSQTAEVFVVPFSPLWLYTGLVVIATGIVYRFRTRIDKALAILLYGEHK